MVSWMSKKLVVFLALLGLVGSACGEATTEVAADGGSEPAAVTDEAVGDEQDGADEAEEATDDGASAVAPVDDGPGDGAAPISYEEGTLGALLYAQSAERATTGRFEGTIVLDGPAGSGLEHATVTLTGSFDDAAQAMELAVDLSDLAGLDEAGVPPQYASSFQEPAQVRVTGGVAYVQWGMLSMLTGQEGGWLALPMEELSATTDSYGVPATTTNPADLLAAYEGAAATTVEDLGTETLRGVETRHWRAVLDLAALAATVDPAQADQLTSELSAAGITEVPVDLWVGVDDGQLRRFETQLTVSDASGTGTVAVAFELYDLGADISITPPPADQVVETPSLGSF